MLVRFLFLPVSFEREQTQSIDMAPYLKSPGNTVGESAGFSKWWFASFDGQLSLGEEWLMPCLQLLFRELAVRCAYFTV
jgi:hypothetical protein